MCRRVTCPSCQRPTYAGCGRHVEQVLGDVAPSARCQCGPRQRREARERTPWWRRVIPRR
nr:MAG: hypothetical protein DIU58_16520 [Sphaerobacter thermophilus]